MAFPVKPPAKKVAPPEEKKAKAAPKSPMPMEDEGEMSMPPPRLAPKPMMAAPPEPEGDDDEILANALLISVLAEKMAKLVKGRSAVGGGSPMSRGPMSME